MDQRYDAATGLPVDRSYLERGLPDYLREEYLRIERCG